MGTWENLGDLGNGLFSKKNWEKPGNWAYGLGIAWEMSIFKNMGGYGVHKINLKKSPACGGMLFNLQLYSLANTHIIKTWEMAYNP